jgi:hypothetical protein
MRLALDLAAPFIDSPQNTAVVVISDFYDGSDFFSVLRQWKESGVHLIPVGSLALDRVLLGQLRVPRQIQRARRADPPRQPQEADRADQEGDVAAMAKKTASDHDHDEPETAAGRRRPPRARRDSKLRMPAEEKYADELAYLASVDQDVRPFAWRLSPRMIRTFILGCRTAGQVRPADRPEVLRRPGSRRAGDRHARLGPRPPADRRPGHRQELAGRAARRRDLGQLDPRRPGHRRHLRGPHQVLVERGDGDRRRQSRESMIPSPIMTAMIAARWAASRS